MSQVSGPIPAWQKRGGALAVSLAVHAALFVWLLTTTIGKAIAPPPQAVMLMLEMVRLPPPPRPPVVEPPKTVAKQVAKRSPPPEQAKAKSEPLRPPHTFTSRDDDWAAEVPKEASVSGSGPRRVPSEYANKVKNRIIAGLVRPKDAVYKAPRDFKGDPKVLQRQCTIPYEITVDRHGRAISHRFDPCGDDLLDAAAEAALANAGPFSPPPDLGAEEYVIYGSANFRTQSGAFEGVDPYRK